MLDVALPAGAVVRDGAQLQLPPDPRSVSAARRFVDARVPDLDDDTRDSLLLLTSELVTNAVVHARTELEVGVTLTDRDVLVTVHDLDLGRSEQRGDERDGGRGLPLVEALSEATGRVAHSGGGKTAWFRLARPGAGRAASTGAG